MIPTKPNRVRGGNRHTRSDRAEARRAFHSTVTDAVYHGINDGAPVRQGALVPSKSETALAPNVGVFFEGDTYSVIERYNPDTQKIETEYITDKSLTSKQHLRIHKQSPTSAITLHGRQWDRRARRLVAVTDPKILSMTDSTLLRRGNPFKQATDIKRESSISKRIELDPDTTRFEYGDQSLQAIPEGAISLNEMFAAMEPPPVGKRGRTSGKILRSTISDE